MVREADPSFARQSLQPVAYDFSNGRLFVDSLPLYDYGFISEGLYDNGGILGLDDATGYPTSDAGLEGGAVYTPDGGTINVTPGTMPNPHAPAVFFGFISSAALLTLGGQDMPTTQPRAGSGQIWNLGGQLCIA